MNFHIVWVSQCWHRIQSKKEAVQWFSEFWPHFLNIDIWNNLVHISFVDFLLNGIFIFSEKFIIVFPCLVKSFICLVIIASTDSKTTIRGCPFSSWISILWVISAVEISLHARFSPIRMNICLPSVCKESIAELWLNFHSRRHPTRVVTHPEKITTVLIWQWTKIMT